MRGYLEFFFERWAFRRDRLEDDAVDAYVRAFSRPGALRASLDDYRAQETDLALDDADFEAGRRLDMPVLALWGSVGLPARMPTLDMWKTYAAHPEHVRGFQIPACGHFIPEEAPEALVEHLDAFLPRSR
ncbi:alpha/beta fold hydrolase [Streptomyces sulfonofaciens]|uniref:alpha/beta fold hydrolase n=1 Tax=Streptomyces sulfonofaciens TaxID=68272 RepID=UPI00167AFA95|nr:alpha/beta hydrolase [Streptomyces sulfonofaciens]